MRGCFEGCKVVDSKKIVRHFLTVPFEVSDTVYEILQSPSNRTEKSKAIRKVQRLLDEASIILADNKLLPSEVIFKLISLEN